MSAQLSLPHRPRLANHTMLRRHLVDGVDKWVVHDTRRSEVVELSEQQLELLLCCDGTRDVGGVTLAAVRAGVYRRASEIEQLLAGLHQRGMLADGIAAKPAIEEGAGDRPLEPLAEFALRCDGNGSCCRSYSSVAFDASERERARRLVGDLAAEVTAGRVFLPLHGSVDEGLSAVAMVDGRCSYLDDGGGCRIHRAGGVDSKPRGCRVFPASFVDDGEAIRVSVAVECGCVMASGLRREAGSGDAALVPPGATRERDLPAGCRVARLPEQLQISHERSAPRALWRSWTQAVGEHFAAVDDGVAAFWSLADTVDAHGLDVDAAHAAMRAAKPPAASSLRFRMMALAGKAAAKRESASGWRSPHDRSVRLSCWLDEAAQALQDDAAVEAALSAPRAAEEAFYFRATIFGHQLVDGRLPVASALRDRATRVLLARQAGTTIVESCRDDPSARHPLTAVEAMMRGQGLDAYALGLP